MKRIFALVLCTLMTVALLAGCGSKKNDDTNTDKTWVVATDYGSGELRHQICLYFSGICVR